MKRADSVGGAGHPVGMTSELPRELHELAWTQDGVLTTSQALGGGLTRAMIRSRLEQRRWQRLETGVYAVFSGPPGRRTVLWGAVLRSGPGAVLSHQTAAELAGLTDRPSSLIHITVPGDRYVERIPGIVIHRSSRVGQAAHPVLAPPRTRLEETVLDLAGAAATLDDACGWITRALGRRLTTQAQLQEAMALRARLRWRRQLAQALTAEWGGVHSSLEYRYLRDVERPHLLPRGVRQARARQSHGTIYRDVLYDQYGLAVELDGRAAHPGDQRWPDIQRDNAAAADGILTLGYGWYDVTERPCQVAAQVATALQLRGYTLARGCSPACPATAVNRIFGRRPQAG
jgi:predicted transcriptional regulator of viral defense system